MARIAWALGAELERGENDRADAGVVDQEDRQQSCPCAGGVYASVSSLLASLANGFNGDAARGDTPDVCRVAACRVVATAAGGDAECRVETVETYMTPLSIIAALAQSVDGARVLQLHGPTLDWSLSVEDLDDCEASTSTSQDLYLPAANTFNANTSTRSSNGESVCTKATIEDLPDEALLHVFSYVAAGGGGLARIARISTVSRQFARVGRDALLRRSAIWDAHTSVLDHISEGGRLTDSGLRGCLRWLRGEAVEFRFRSYDDYRASAPVTATWRELGFLCPALTTLELYHIRQVDDSVVATIAAHCRQLRTVRLERCAVGNDGIEALALCCPSLTSLHASVHLAHMSLQDGRPPLGYSGRALRALACRDSLRVLKLKSSCHEMDDASLKEFVMGCNKLRVLTLFMAVNLTDASLAEVGSGLRELESLSLDCWYSATDEGLASLRGLSRLHTFKARYGGIGFTGNGLLSVVRNCPAVRKVKANYHVTVGACLALLEQHSETSQSPHSTTPTTTHTTHHPAIRPDLLPQLWSDVLTAVEKLCGGLDDSHASAHALDVPHDPNPHNSPWSSVDLSHGTIRLITVMLARVAGQGDESQVLRLLLALETYIYGLSALIPDGPDAEDFLTQEKRVQLDEAIIARTPQVVVSIWETFSSSDASGFSGMVPARACAVLGQLQDLAAQLGPARKCEMACMLLMCGAVKLAADALIGQGSGAVLANPQAIGMTLKELSTMRARELGYLLMRSDHTSLSHSRLAYYYAARAHVMECHFRARGFERLRLRQETLHTLAAALSGLSTLPALTTDQESQLRAALLPSDIRAASLHTDLISALLSVATEVPKLSLCRNECHLGGFTGFDDWPSWLLHQHHIAVANVCDVLGALCLRTCPAHDGTECRTAHPKPHLPHLIQKLLARVLAEDEAWRQLLHSAHGLICGYDTQQQQVVQQTQMLGRVSHDLSASRVAALLFQLIIELAELAGDCAIGQTAGHEFVRSVLEITHFPWARHPRVLRSGLRALAMCSSCVWARRDAQLCRHLADFWCRADPGLKACAREAIQTIVLRLAAPSSSSQSSSSLRSTFGTPKAGD